LKYVQKFKKHATQSHYYNDRKFRIKIHVHSGSSTNLRVLIGVGQKVNKRADWTIGNSPLLTLWLISQREA
jgi:hypothetical protein